MDLGAPHAGSPLGLLLRVCKGAGLRLRVKGAGLQGGGCGICSCYVGYIGMGTGEGCGISGLSRKPLVVA